MYTIVDSYKSITEEALRDFEARIGTSLPRDYRAFLLKSNGGTFLDTVRSPDGTQVSRLYGLNTGLEGALELRREFMISIGLLEPTDLAIGCDLNENDIFMTLQGPQRGTIFYLPPEDPLDLDESEILGSSFSEFMNSLVTEFPESDPLVSPAFNAILQSDSKELKRLLSQGASPDESNNEGITLLMHATRHSRIECMKMLIEANANIEQADSRGKTAVFYAVSGDHIDALKTLLQHKANVDAIDDTGNSVLMYAIEWEMVRSALTLIENGANTQYVSPAGKTARSFCKEDTYCHQYVLPKLK